MFRFKLTVVIKMSSTHQDSMRIIKEQLIEEHGPYCWCCREMFQLGNLEGHHILPRASQGKNEKENIAILCHECHSKLHILINYSNWKKYNKSIRKIKYNSSVLKEDWLCFSLQHPIKTKKMEY